MINFVAVNGQPKFEANEDLIKKSGMSVNSNFLDQAIKTKEDWENLFVITDADLKVQKETVRQQQLEIERQKAEILRQKALLDSLDKEITAKEKTLLEKQKVLNIQLVQIGKQKGEITTQKQTIVVQQEAVRVQQDTLSRQKEKISTQILMMNDQLKKIGEQEGKIKIQLATLENQKLILYFFVLHAKGRNRTTARSCRSTARPDCLSEEAYNRFNNVRQAYSDSADTLTGTLQRQA
jgi:chromosome segregation ATPase